MSFSSSPSVARLTECFCGLRPSYNLCAANDFDAKGLVIDITNTYPKFKLNLLSSSLQLELKVLAKVFVLIVLLRRVLGFSSWQCLGQNALSTFGDRRSCRNGVGNLGRKYGVSNRWGKFLFNDSIQLFGWATSHG